MPKCLSVYVATSTERKRGIGMDQTKAQREILKLWKDWQSKSPLPTQDEMYDFFVWIEQNEPDLLMFRVDAMQGKERWQIVVAWLTEYEEKR